MIDTLQLSQDLSKAFSPEQAEALAKAFAKQDEGVTKKDLDLGLGKLRGDLDLGLGILRKDLDLGLEKLRSDLTYRIVGAVLLNFVGVIGLMITLIKVIH